MTKAIIALFIMLSFGTAHHEDVGHGEPVEVEHKRTEYRATR